MLCAPTAAANAAQADWKKTGEQTLAAAKKKVRSPSTSIDTKACCTISSATIPASTSYRFTGRGSELTSRLMAEAARGQIHRRCDTAVGQAACTTTLYRGKALDPLKPDLLILPGVTDILEVVRQRAPLRRPGRKIYFSRSSAARATRSSPATRRWSTRKNSNLLGYRRSKWKGKIVSSRPARHGPGRDHAGSTTIVPRSVPNTAKIFGGMDITYAKNFRQMTDWLAAGEVCYLHGLQGFHARQEPRFAGGRFRYQQMEGRIRVSQRAADRWPM